MCKASLRAPVRAPPYAGVCHRMMQVVKGMWGKGVGVIITVPPGTGNASLVAHLSVQVVALSGISVNGVLALG